MQYVEFKKMVADSVAERIEASVRIEEVQKNNGVVLDGLVIKREGEELSPTIYLNGYFERIEDGSTYDDVVNDIVETYESHRLTCGDIANKFMDYDWVKDNLIMRLVNTEKNKEMLDDVPHIKFLDLTIVFAVRMLVKSGLYGSALIHNRHVECWGVDPCTLYEDAKKSCKEILPPMQISMSSLLGGAMPDDIMQALFEEDPMYVVSNNERSFGAAVMLYPDAYKYLADKFESDMYIIPSSVHETIAVPVNSGIELEALNQMIPTVNAGSVQAQEVLSDHAYIYIRETGRIEIA